MKKIVIIVISILTIVAVSSYYLLPGYAITLVKEYDPYTFERVLLDDTMRINYGIYDKQSPQDYGFLQFDEVTFRSIYDDNQLTGWYVPASKPSSQTIILIHGRWSNRLKTMKYLEIIKSYQLDSLYNVLIPDLRNSGKSQPAETMMGYEFSEDIASSIVWLSQNRRQSEVLLYGFSMGGMAVATLLNRDELMSEISTNEVVISRLILDSPIANVEKILLKGGREAGLPKLIVKRTVDLLNHEFDGYVSKMKFSLLLKDITIPILILQGTNDLSQPIDILQTELAQLSKPDLKLEVFENGEHVKLYQVDQHKERYASIINGFIRN